MILDYKNMEIFGETVFFKAKIQPPYKDLYLMPDNACFLHMPNGVYNE